MLRRAEAEDAVPLTACVAEAYGVHAARDLDLPDVAGGIADDIRDSLVWVAVHNGDILGGVVLYPRGDHAVLANLAVRPAAAGQGLGRALVALAEREAWNLGIDQLYLTTHADIPENIRLYVHLGWHETGRTGKKVFMGKRLTEPS